MTDSFVYCWTDHLTGKLYVGVHKGQEDDGYVCSSALMLEEYEKRPDDFSREIVARGTWSDCTALERSILCSANAAYSDDFYNMSNGGGVDYTPEVRAKMSEAQKGKVVPEDTRRKMSEAHKGKVFSKEHRQNLSKAARKRQFRFINNT